MFHAHNGWYFKRDGFDVVVLRGESFEKAQEVVRFDGNTWASIIASVSRDGENSSTFLAALNLHLYSQVTTPTDI